MYANTTESLEIPLTSEAYSGAASSMRGLRSTSEFESGRPGAVFCPIREFQAQVRVSSMTDSFNDFVWKLIDGKS